MEIERFLGWMYYGGDMRVMEVENDGDDRKVVCSNCRKPISAPAFKHRYRDLFFHLACAPTSDKALVFHFGSRHGRLIFTEEVKNDGNEEEAVVCFGCEKPLLSGQPGYKCSSTSECKLLLHQSCAEQLPQIRHRFHPNHTLVLKEPKEKYCNACGKNCNKYAFYRCSECDFNLDFRCATRSRSNNSDDCQHSFVSFFKEIKFTCEACGEEGKELASLCTICQLLIHGKCARFSSFVRITRHDHSLALTYSLRRVKQHLGESIFCKLCFQKVKVEYAVYYCQECDYVVHLTCAFKYKRSMNRKSLPEESVDLVAADHVLEVEGAGQIRHFSHQHDLIFNKEELTDDKLCDGCMGLISTPFYSCTECDFFLHSRCARLPRKKRLELHPHQLTLISQAPFFNGLFTCAACKRLSGGFAYRCDMSYFFLDLQCCSVPNTLEHEGHQHTLFLAVNSNRRCYGCNCISGTKAGIFVCISSDCNFALGFECATLPLVVRHRYDDHVLKLTYIAEDHHEEYYCLICEEKRDSNHWFYYCAECDFPAHTKCVLGKYPYIKFGSSFTSEDYHQHPLTFVPTNESSTPCVACGKTFDGMALDCTQCKFNVHDDCLWKLKNHPHLGRKVHHNFEDSSCVASYS